MKVIQLPVYSKNVLRALLGMHVTEKPIPEIKVDEVLVKMHFASCNPSDIAFIQGGYNIVKTLPCVPGFEGSGQVIKAGKQLEHLIGKNIACFIQENRDGTWAEYFVANKKDLLVLKPEMKLEQAACLLINPFTAYALVKMAARKKCNAIIQNASGGQVAHFVRYFASAQNIKVIDIVRKKETFDLLTGQGVKHVLYEQSENFDEQLNEIALKMNTTIAFDAVCGPNSAKIMHAMPSGSQLVVYGALSGKNISEIDFMDVIFKDKSVTGFNLVSWKENLSQEDFEKISDHIQDLFIQEKLKTTIQDIFKMDNIVDGLKKYLGNMSSGKVLLKP